MYLKAPPLYFLHFFISQKGKLHLYLPDKPIKHQRMKKIVFLSALITLCLIKFTAFAQIDKYLNDGLMSDTAKKIALIGIKFPVEIIGFEVTASEAKTYTVMMGDTIQKYLKQKVTVISESSIADVKKKNSAIALCKIDSYTLRAGSWGRKSAEIAGTFLYFKNANDKEPAKKITFSERGDETVGMNGPLENAINAAASKIALQLK